MSQPAIKVENLSKAYRLGQRAGANGRDYRTFRDALIDTAKAPFRRLRQLGRDDTTGDDTFWALKDVSFEVQPGEVVGIIGRNGAGKSTLLKILSRITEPTGGRVTLRGRVGSLLEVGTGFHPELTGRENIYLNGSILGMSRAEVSAQFDQIVDFSGVEQFLDTPVKRYSSGMYVRLAFAIASHLDLEMLFIDEVLAVGDAMFQRKCIDRMTELTRSGKTLLFVSHNMDLIPKLCMRAIYLDGGQVRAEGAAGKVTDEYLRRLMDSREANLEKCHRRGGKLARFESINLLNDANNVIEFHRCGDDLRCVIEVRSESYFDDVAIAVVVKTLQGARLITSWTQEVGFDLRLKPGVQRYECRFQNVRIRPGRQVIIELWMAASGEELDTIDMARVVDVIDGHSTAFSSRPDQGNYLCDYTWSHS